MTVTIVYYGQARQAAGVDSEILEVPDAASLAEAVARAADGRGDALKQLLFTEAGALRKSTLLTRNGAATDDTTGPLQASTEIGVFPALAGG